jgi:SAM-dependent methyltransferase
MFLGETPPAADPSPGPASADFWDRRYQEGSDGWELGEAAPPLSHFLRCHPRAPRPAGREQVLVPGCGRGHEARLLAELGFATVGLDFSGRALEEARRIHSDAPASLHWLQADLFDQDSLTAHGLGAGTLAGVLEHTCFCAIDPAQRPAYLRTVVDLLAPGGWLLALFWCHDRQGGPPFGSDPDLLASQLEGAGLRAELWEPASASAQSRDQSRRDGEWLGLWRKPALLSSLFPSSSSESTPHP